MDPAAARVAKNDAIFRDANEQIERAADGAGVEHVPFICECADPSCTEIVRLMRHEYEEIRRDGRLFLNVPGHDESAEGYGAVVRRTDRYVVVEKTGEAGEIAEALDPRDSGRVQ